MVTQVLLRAGSCTLILALAGCVQPTGGAPGQPGAVAQGPAASTPLAMSRMQLPQVRMPQMQGQPAPGTQPPGAPAAGSRIAMPRFTLPWGRPAAAGAAPGQVVDPFAGQGVRQATAPAGQPAGSSGAAATAQAAAASHTVAAGETAWSIARRYGVTADALAQANALPASMAVRVGQRLAIPARAGTTTVAVAAPGVGSATPQPPSASRPLPSERTRPAGNPAPRADAPDMGQTRTAASGSGRFAMPVNGSIVRPYKKGSNEGIDISAAPGSAVRAASAGTVAAVTRDTDGVPIVVVRHDGGLMTVYAGIDGLKVAKGDSVSAGQSIGSARSEGVVHFEVRKGFDSVDPEGYL